MLCLDTNIVSNAINRRRPELANRISAELRAGTPMAIPSIVRFELEHWIAKGGRAERNRAILNQLLAQGFTELPFDAEDALEAGRIRADLEKRGTPIGPYDVLIAAQVRRRSAILVTLNLREFQRVPGLMVTDWGN